MSFYQLSYKAARTGCLVLLLFMPVLLMPANPETPPHQLYRIQQPKPELLRSIEQKGGIVAAYKPGDYADVYMSNALFNQYKSWLASPKQITRDLTPLMLSEDHRIGLSYHSYEAIRFILDSLSVAYPNLIRLETIGQTVQGREIQAVCLGDNPAVEEPEPELRLIGSMHGNEPLGQELMLMLIDSLLNGYGKSERITKLMDNAEIWIIPNMNYDGAAVDERSNANGSDLNRSFPDREFDLISDPAGREPEVQAIMNWSAAHNFILAANFHTGSLLVNYPWDKNIGGATGYAACADDAMFIELSLSYSRYNPPMYASAYFNNGITNGTMWYEISGSMQDWNYHWLGCMEVTIELSYVYRPADSLIAAYWMDNRQSLLAYMENVQGGLRGVITDSSTGLPLSAAIRVNGIDKTLWSDPDLGDYYRLLPDGDYQVTIEADGYQKKVFTSVQIDSGSATVRNALLQKNHKFLLSGYVRESKTGAAIANAELKFISDLYADSVNSAPDGSFAVRLPAARYVATVSKTGYAALIDYLMFTSDSLAEYLLTVLPKAKICGRVLTADYGSCLGAVVYCRGATDSLKNDAEYCFSGLDADTVNIYAYKTGYQTTRIDTVLRSGDSLWIELILHPGYNEVFCDFETDSGGFTATGEWQYGQLQFGPDQAYSGQNVWATGLTGGYPKGAHLAALTTPILSMQGMIIPQIEFYHWYDFEENYDGGNLKISVDEGHTWQIIHGQPDYNLAGIPFEYHNPLGGQPAFSGQSGNWQRVVVDLRPYQATPFIILRFEQGCDDQKEAGGWYIDDFKLFDGNAVYLGSGSSAEAGMQAEIFPNPANPSATIRFRSDVPGMINISVFNVLGQRVVSRKVEAQAGEWISWVWAGRDDQNQDVSSGVYWIRLTSLSVSLVKKIVLLR
jgi:hypothetical protein